MLNHCPVYIIAVCYLTDWRLDLIHWDGAVRVRLLLVVLLTRLLSPCAFVCVCVCCWLGCCQLCVSHLDTYSALLTFFWDLPSWCPNVHLSWRRARTHTHTFTHKLLKWPIIRSVGTKQEWHSLENNRKKAVLVLPLKGSACETCNF